MKWSPTSAKPSYGAAPRANPFNSVGCNLHCRTEWRQGQRRHPRSQAGQRLFPFLDKLQLLKRELKVAPHQSREHIAFHVENT